MRTCGALPLCIVHHRPQRIHRLRQDGLVDARHVLNILHKEQSDGVGVVSDSKRVLWEQQQGGTERSGLPALHVC